MRVGEGEVRGGHTMFWRLHEYADKLQGFHKIKVWMAIKGGAVPLFFGKKMQ